MPPRRPKPTPPSERLLTVREIAELDGCSEKTVYRAINAGHLEAIRIGPGHRLLRIRTSAHEAYLAARRT